MFSSEGSIEYARIVAQAWIDPQFREKLIADPKSALGEHGITVPDDIVVSVRPGAGTSRLELVLPDKPDMSEERLGRYAASERTQKTHVDQPSSSRSDNDDETPKPTHPCTDDQPDTLKCKPTGGGADENEPLLTKKTKY